MDLSTTKEQKEREGRTPVLSCIICANLFREGTPAVTIGRIVNGAFVQENEIVDSPEELQEATMEMSRSLGIKLDLGSVEKSSHPAIAHATCLTDMAISIIRQADQVSQDRVSTGLTLNKLFDIDIDLSSSR